MAVVGSIHILTDRKAKVLTALKASLRAYESVISPDDAKKVGSLIDGEVFETVYNACADELSQDIAIYLSDDYVSVCYEDIELSELEKNAAGFCEAFEKPTLYVAIIDEDSAVFGVCRNGKLRTRLTLGEYLDELDLAEEKINMDELAHVFNAHNLTDLNECRDVAELCYALDEDYGINPELSPLSLPLYSDEYKLLEKSKTFSVYSSLTNG